MHDARTCLSAHALCNLLTVQCRTHGDAMCQRFQVQFLEDDKTGLLLFHAENIDGVIELDNSEFST